MDQYIGLDVSLKDTAISIREDGKRTWRGKCASDPKIVSQVIRKHAPRAKRVVFETGQRLVQYLLRVPRFDADRGNPLGR